MKALGRTLAAALLWAVAASPGFAAGPSVTIYPSGATVPENLLRIELRFSDPLREPLTIAEVRLLDARGREIPSPFLDLPLPTADGRRVTILLHPGRVKSGLQANLTLGRALHAGATVTLVVDHPALAQPVRKTWQVTPFDAVSPQPERWRFAPPRRGSRSPLVVHLDAPISSTAEVLIAIRGPDGERVAGVARLEQGETVWRFVPTQPWRVGNYALVTHPDLEDPAGNRPCATFETIKASQVRCAQGTVQTFAPWTNEASCRRDAYRGPQRTALNGVQPRFHGDRVVDGGPGIAGYRR